MENATPIQLTNDTSEPVKTTNPLLKYLPVGIVVIVLLVISSVYFFIVLPRMNTKNAVNKLLPKVAEMKSTTNQVESLIERIRVLVTNEIKQDVPSSLETKGLLIHPEVAQILVDKNVLGASTVNKNQYGMLEKFVLQITERVKNITSAFTNKNENVAGADTMLTSSSLSQFRNLKDQSILAGKSVVKAEGQLSDVVMTSISLQEKLTGNSKTVLLGSNDMSNVVTPYYREGKKMSKYYETLSDSIIVMNTKIDSFKTSITSAAGIFSNVETAKDTETVKTLISQAQVFLDQAKTDTDAIKSISNILNGFSKSDLPEGSTQYHEHNLAVLAAVTDYFSTESSIMQDYINSTKNVLAKIDAKTVTVNDIYAYQNQIIIGIGGANVAEAKFISKLQTLLGEETPLTLTFWQNALTLRDSVKVKRQIADYENNLTKLRSDNKIIFLDK